MLHKEAVTPELFEVLKSLMRVDELNPFRLVGGTAIALQLGHRKSVDIDLFSNEKVDLKNISRALKEKFPEIKNITRTQTHITTFIHGVRIDIYDDWSIPFKKEPVFKEGIRLTALEDLAAFKLSTIIERREKKDYIDLYFLFNHLTATKILKGFKSYEPLLSDKSLVFALAEVTTAKENKSPMPNMLTKINWAEMTKVFIEESRKYVKFRMESKMEDI
jgi:predicted nucleotidyltransferase component of viral defense system